MTESDRVSDVPRSLIDDVMANYENKPEDEVCLRDQDICCGRGRGPSKHPGNQMFQNIIHYKAEEFSECSYKKDKSRMIVAIVHEFLLSGARFLKRDSSEDKWIVLEEGMARVKTGHAIRDYLVLKSKKEGKNIAKKVIKKKAKATIRAIEAAPEQLDSMNYYHSIRELKEQAAAYPTSHVSSNNNSGVLAGVDVHVHANLTKDIWKSTTDDHNDHDRPRSQPVESNQGDLIISDDVPQVGNDLIRKQKLLVVETWLLLALPELHPKDLSAYSHRLMEDGFDSLTLLQMDLVPADLEFMKKAHQRAIVRAYPFE
jgi:hypothetical protein